MPEEKAKGEGRKAKVTIAPADRQRSQLDLPFAHTASAVGANGEAAAHGRSGGRSESSELPLVVPTRPRRARAFQIFHQLGELLRRQSKSRPSDPPPHR